MPTMQRIPVEQIHVDDRYQRELDSARVKRITEKYDADKFGALEVNQRNGKGSYYVFDGQHRLMVAKVIGLDKVPCIIHKGLSPEREAELFATQKALAKSIHPVEKFRARVFCGDARATEIDRIAAEAGFVIRSAGPDRGRQRAINTPNALDRVYGLGVLPETLALLDQLWGGDDHSTDAPLIEGLGIMVKGYGHRIGPAERSKLIDVAPITLIRRAVGRMESISSGGSLQRAEAVAKEIRSVAGLRGKPSARFKAASAA